MAIRKVFKNGVWQYEGSYYDYGPTGKLDDKKRGYFLKKSEADTFVSEGKKARKQPGTTQAIEEQGEERLTIEGLAKNYFESAQFKKLRDSSKVSMRRRVNSYVEWALAKGYVYADQTTRNTALAYESYVIDTWKGKGRESRLIAASTLYARDMKREKPAVTRNPFEVVPKTGYYVRKAVRYLTPEELDALFSCMSPKQYHAFGLKYNSGTRTGELRFLKWTQVNLELRLIDLGEQPDWKPKEDGMNTVIPINDAAMEHLLWWHERTGSKTFVIGDGDKPVAATFFWKGLKKFIIPRAKKKFPHLEFAGVSPHTFRKTFATYLAKFGGANTRQITGLTRHKSEKVAREIYIAVEVEELKPFANKLPGIPTSAPLLKIGTGIGTRKKKIANSRLNSQEIVVVQ